MHDSVKQGRIEDHVFIHLTHTIFHFQPTLHSTIIQHHTPLLNQHYTQPLSTTTLQHITNTTLHLPHSHKNTRPQGRKEGAIFISTLQHTTLQHTTTQHTLEKRKKNFCHSLQENYTAKWKNQGRSPHFHSTFES
ncbi:hypothetical protein Dimus_038541 [Dionaea muscipula]